MSSFSYAIDMNIRRYKNLLATSVNEAERKTIQNLLAEEISKAGGGPAIGAEENWRTYAGAVNARNFPAR